MKRYLKAAAVFAVSILAISESKAGVNSHLQSIDHGERIIEVLQLANMISCESNITGELGMKLVANAILNRAASRYYPSTVERVVSESNQFEPFGEGCRRSLRDPAHQRVIEMAWSIARGEMPRMTHATMFVQEGLRPSGWDFDAIIKIDTIAGHDWYVEKRVLREGIFDDLPTWLANK